MFCFTQIKAFIGTILQGSNLKDCYESFVYYEGITLSKKYQAVVTFVVTFLFLLKRL